MQVELSVLMELSALVLVLMVRMELSALVLMLVVVPGLGPVAGRRLAR